MSGRHQTERDLHTAIVDLLRATVPPQWWFCPNVEVRGGAHAARAGGIAKRRGSNAGWPDILVINPRTMRITGIELKSKRGRVSEHQAAVRSAWRENYHICTSFDDAVFLIKQAGWDVAKAKGAQEG